jgi:predicted nucleic acid-binding protein
MSRRLAVDTSVAVPLLLASHPEHDAVVAWQRGRRLHLTGHSMAETYSVLTRLPGVGPDAAGEVARVIGARFEEPFLLPAEVGRDLPQRLATAGIAGGAVYDAMVGLAAVAAGVPLVTRDARAASTYRVVGATLEILAQP